jgi:hypothetical protein
LIESLESTETVTLKGFLREIDLDKGMFEVADSKGTRHKCKIREDLVTEALEFLRDQREVLVRGIRIRRTLKVLLMEPIRGLESGGALAGKDEQSQPRTEPKSE